MTVQIGQIRPPPLRLGNERRHAWTITVIHERYAKLLADYPGSWLGYQVVHEFEGGSKHTCDVHGCGRDAAVEVWCRVEWHEGDGPGVNSWRTEVWLCAEHGGTMHDDERYDGWLVSNDLGKRSLAVVGHYLVGQLIIGAPLFLMLMILSALGQCG